MTFPSQTVDRSGMIAIPYGGEVRAAGRSIPEIQREIESKAREQPRHRTTSSGDDGRAECN